MSANPKDQAAKAEGKTRLDLLEPVANKATADALAFGAITKGYGIQNYRQVPITTRTYLAAIQRHLDALKTGEDFAPDSGVHHLGHIAANVHVWLGALEAGVVDDDRGPGPVGPNPVNGDQAEWSAASDPLVVIGPGQPCPWKCSGVCDEAEESGGYPACLEECQMIVGDRLESGES